MPAMAVPYKTWRGREWFRTHLERHAVLLPASWYKVAEGERRERKLVDIKEILLAENERLKSQFTSICSDLTNEQVVFDHEAIDERGIGNVVLHAYGSILNRARTVNGLTIVPESDLPRTTDALMAFIDGTHQQVQAQFADLNEERLQTVVEYGTRRKWESPGIELLMAGFAHAYRHVGSVLDARHLGGFETHALG